jgi:predicted dinucleotide-binding enzyme
MKFGVLGTGTVGQTLGGKLISLGHEVKMGSRQAGNEVAVAWTKSAAGSASEGTFSDAAAFGETVINATNGAASLEALKAAGAENLEGKVLIDVTNPLDFSAGLPPTLTVGNTDSLGEQIQREFPDVKVVKTLNTMSADVMVEPSLVPGSHTVLLGGEDAEAKTQVKAMLQDFGWPAEDILDLGSIAAARGMEAYVTLWLRFWGATGTRVLNIKLQAASSEE